MFCDFIFSDSKNVKFVIFFIRAITLGRRPSRRSLYRTGSSWIVVSCQLLYGNLRELADQCARNWLCSEVGGKTTKFGRLDLWSIFVLLWACAEHFIVKTFIHTQSHNPSFGAYFDLTSLSSTKWADEISKHVLKNTGSLEQKCRNVGLCETFGRSSKNKNSHKRIDTLEQAITQKLVSFYGLS